MKTGILGLAVASVALVSMASYADVIHETGTVNNSGANFAINSTGSFDVAQFNSSLGTLQSVEITINGYSTGGTVSYTNTGAGSSDVTVSIKTTVSVSGPDSLVIVTTPTQTVTQNNVTTSFSLPAGNGSNTNSSTVTAPNLTPYIGLGNITFNFDSSMLALLSTTGEGNSSVSDNKFYFTYDVAYTYDTVPEVASLGMLSFGALALLARRRK